MRSYTFCVFSIGGFTMPAPMSHVTIKSNYNIFNNLRLLFRQNINHIEKKIHNPENEHPRA